MYSKINRSRDESGSFDSSLQSSAILQEDSLSQNFNLSKPSGKLIYNQRKQFAESLQRQAHSFQHRVEHLFTCDLDGRAIRSLDDCVMRLQFLDAKGQIWGQDVILEVQNDSLYMIDIETKEELESLALGHIVDMKAKLGRCVYKSLLMIEVQLDGKGVPSVFIFHCEEIKAEYICMDLEKAVQHWKEGMGSWRLNRDSLENKTDRKRQERFIATEPPSEKMDKRHPDELPLSWDNPDYDSSATLRTEHPQPKELVAPQPVQYTEAEVDVEIFNHLLHDIELFMDRMPKVLPKESKKKKIKNLMKMSKKDKAVKGLPPQEEYVSCLQKVKYGFNLLGKLKDELNNPSAPDLVHCLFTVLSALVQQYPLEIPSTVISPLLTKQAIRLLSEEANTKEDQLWQSLGDPWNIPSEMWPDDEPIPPYTAEFSDGWQPPEPVKEKPPKNALSSSNEQKSFLGSSSLPRSAGAAPLYMRAKYDFAGRNNQELSVLKGDVVQVLDQSKQWWKICNSKNKEGYVPNNLLECMGQDEPKEIDAIVSLNKQSKPEEVKAWLEEKGFSSVTVRCLSVLNGSLLLGMSHEELKIMCPKEGRQVFAQLQTSRTAIP